MCCIVCEFQVEYNTDEGFFLPPLTVASVKRTGQEDEAVTL